jgi:hypothetical protein
MTRSGNYYYGKGGFAFKKNSGAGVRRIVPLGLLNGIKGEIFNSYISGAGVGAQSTAVRRSKLRHATICNTNIQCGQFITQLGQQTNRNYSLYN